MAKQRTHAGACRCAQAVSPCRASHSCPLPIAVASPLAAAILPACSPSPGGQSAAAATTSASPPRTRCRRAPFSTRRPSRPQAATGHPSARLCAAGSRRQVRRAAMRQNGNLQLRRQRVETEALLGLQLLYLRGAALIFVNNRLSPLHRRRGLLRDELGCLFSNGCLHGVASV